MLATGGETYYSRRARPRQLRRPRRPQLTSTAAPLLRLLRHRQIGRTRRYGCTAFGALRGAARRGGGARAAPVAEVDDLKRIRGIGVLIEKKLNSLGVTHYEQVANWTGADIERISNILDFKGRIERENWIEQARILATGGQTEFSRRNEA